MPLSLIAVRALQFSAVAMLLGGPGLLLALHRRDAVALAALRGAAVCAAVSGAAWFAMVYVDVTGGVAALVDPEAWGAFLSAPFGWPWLVRLLLCALGLVVAGRSTPALCLALGVGFAIDQAWLGHAGNDAGLEAATQLLVYCLHVVAGFAWVGALAMLCLLTIVDGRVPDDGLDLFSLAGTFVVATILASGIANAALRGLRFGDLATTDYGHMVLVKLALFAGMAGFATFNRLRSRHASGGLQLSVASETALGLAILVVAARLGITPPP